MVVRQIVLMGPKGVKIIVIIGRVNCFSIDFLILEKSGGASRSPAKNHPVDESCETASKRYEMSSDSVISYNLFESTKHFQTILCLLLVTIRSFHDL